MLVVYGSAWTWRWRWSTELNGGMWKPNLIVSISTCRRVLRKRRNKPALWERNVQFIQHNVSYFFHGFNCNIMQYERRVVEVIGNITYQVLRPNFEETLHFLYLVLWAWKGLSESTTIHTPMCRLGMTRKWCLLAGFRSLKATNESSWGIRSH